MKKVLKVIGIVFLLFIILIVLLIVKATITPMVPKDYTQTVSTGGAIEEKYLEIGPCQVSHYEEAANDILKKYHVYYPSELADSSKTYPAVVFVNGTGVPASKYTALFEHLASWGFIVIGSEDKDSWSGTSSDQCLDFLIQQVENQDSIFIRRLTLTISVYRDTRKAASGSLTRLQSRNTAPCIRQQSRYPPHTKNRPQH